MIDIEGETLRLLREITAEMSSHAELRIERRSSIEGLVIELIPSNERAASVWVVATNAHPTSGATLVAGYSCHIEWGVENEQALAAYLRELSEICHAVAAGLFAEEAWFKNNKLVAANGTIRINAKERTFQTKEFFARRSGSSRKVLHYAPYRPR